MAHVLCHSDSPAALRVPKTLLAGSGVSVAGASIDPQGVYDGQLGVKDAKILLRIANGGAGQSGFIGAWADAFIQYWYKKNKEAIKVAWYLGDTTESLGFLAAGQVDIAVTYNDAAERQACNSGAAVKRVYGFRDHFYLVGPTSNPAKLKVGDHINRLFRKIVNQGNKDVVTPPKGRPNVRFLSRFDKSATNMKDSQLFLAINQVPWALPYSKWYHQYPRFPLEALSAASKLYEYTVTDRGTWLSSCDEVTYSLTIFAQAEDKEDDKLLNPAHVLLGKTLLREDIANEFIDWVIRDDGGQEVVDQFKKGGEQLYTRAPPDNLDLSCSSTS